MIKILIWIHNFSYRVIGVLTIKENGGIHPKHKILQYEKFFLNNIKSKDAVLDIGCGNGFLAHALSQKAGNIIGIDISKKNIILAKKRFSSDNLEYIIGDATAYDFKKNFDAIILSNVLEHIKDRVGFLQKIKKLAPKILIRVPLLTRDWLAVYKKENSMEYRLDNTHRIEYMEESFKDEMNKAGLEVESSYVKFGELYAILRNA